MDREKLMAVYQKELQAKIPPLTLIDLALSEGYAYGKSAGKKEARMDFLMLFLGLLAGGCLYFLLFV